MLSNCCYQLYTYRKKVVEGNFVQVTLIRVTGLITRFQMVLGATHYIPVTSLNLLTRTVKRILRHHQLLPTFVPQASLQNCHCDWCAQNKFRSLNQLHSN